MMDAVRRLHVSIRLAIGACAWSAFVIALAIVLPIHTVDSGRAGVAPRHSLVRDYGYAVLWRASVPLVVCVVILVLLVLARREPSMAARSARRLAWVLAVLLAVGAFIGTITFLIGIFVLPAGALAVAACATATAPEPAEAG